MSSSSEPLAVRAAAEVRWQNPALTGHAVQFYEQDDHLIEAVTLFTASGLVAGAACVVVATPAHREALEKELSDRGLPIHDIKERGQLVLCDAAELLSQSMKDGLPDRERFLGSVGRVVETAASWDAGVPVRVFGEMVDLLWAAQNQDAAIRLEELWNELAKERSFSLLCAYPIHHFGRVADSDAFVRVCSVHGTVLPLGSAQAPAEPDGQNRAMAQLQQRAHALAAEVAALERTSSELKRGEAELTGLVEHALEGMHRVGPDGTILWANRAELELLGYEPHEYVGHHISEFHVDGEVIAAILERLLGGDGIHDQPARLRCKDGSVKYVRIHSNGVFEDGKLVHARCFTRDVSEQVKLHEALAAELKATQRLHALSTQLIRADDLATMYQQTLDMAVEIMGSDFASLQMFDPDRGELQLLGHRGFSAEAARFWEWVRPASASTCGKALLTGERCMVADVRTCEFMAGTEDLSTYLETGIHAVQTTPLYSRARVLIGMISTHWREPHAPAVHELRLLDVLARQAADLIERSHADRALRESEVRFRTLADTAPAMLWITDTRNEATFLSRGWFEYTAQTEGEAVGHGWTQAVHPDDRDKATQDFLAAAERRQPFAIDYRLHRADGKYRWAIDAGRPRFDAHGRWLGYVGVVIDVHERKLYEEALHAADRRKDEFLAMLAHELRNHLAPMRNAVEIMKLANDGRGHERSREMIERQLHQVVRLVDDLLDVSRITGGKLLLHKERVELAAVVRSALETSQPLIDASRHTLSVDLPSKPIWVEVDPTRIAQVLSNLLNNAAKYTEPGGHIQIGVAPRVHSVALQVRDTGMGIREEMLAGVFDLFAQVDRTIGRSQGGLGIGLALVKRVVELHGGSVEARSDGPGEGSEFTVCLPLADHGEDDVVPGEISATPRRLFRKRRILVVDDNREAAESLATFLELEGHQVEVAFGAQEALEAVRLSAPELVLLDIGLPEMDGYEVARRMRQASQLSDTVLIAVTGFGQDEDRARAGDAGFQHHLVKPLDLELLASLIQEGKRAHDG